MSDEETMLLQSQSDEKLLKRLQALQEELHFAGHRLPEKAVVLLLLKKLPFFSNFLHSIDSAGNTLSKLAIIQGHAVHTAEVAGSGFQWANLGLALIDFFRIPLIYLAAALIGQKPPMTLAKNARWLYSAVLLALTIASLAIPAAAPPIALATAILGLGVSIFLLVKYLKERHQINKALQKLDAELQTIEESLRGIQTLARALQKKIDTDPSKLQEYAGEIENLEQSFSTLKKEIQNLYDQQTHLKQKLEKMGFASVVDKTVAIALSAMALIGLTLSLAFPLVGLGIVAAAAAAGGVYILARITLPLIRRFGQWVLNKLYKDSNATTGIDEQKDKPEMNLKSTGLTMLKLHGQTAAVQALQEQAFLEKKLDQIEHKLQLAAHQDNLKGILQALKEVALYAQEHQTSLEELRDFLGQETMKASVHSLQQAVKEVELSSKHKDQLLSYVPLVGALLEKEIDLTEIATKKVATAKHTPGLFHEEGTDNGNPTKKLSTL